MAVKNVVFRLQAETGRLRKELDEVKRSVAGIGDNTEQAEKQFNGLTASIKKVGAAIGAIAVGRALFNFGKSAITAAADFEKLEVSFSTFLGSTKEAEKVLKDLEELSVSTPFTPEQVQQAGKALLAFGIETDKLQTSLRQIGDVSSATGKDFNELAVIFGKAKVQGTLFAEDINQLTEAGVPVIQEFAKQLGVSEGQVKKLGSEGQITFANLEAAFASLTGEGGKFFGLTDALSKTTAGRISTLQGNFGLLLREIGQGLLPVFESLLEVAFKVVNAFQNFGLFFNNNRKSIALFTSAVSLLIGALTRQTQIQIANRIQTVIGTLATRRAAIAQRFQAAQRLFNIRTMRTQNVVQKAATAATIAGTIATRAFNAALRSNPIGILLTGLSIAASFFLDFTDSADEAALATGELGEEVNNLSRKEQALNTVREESIKRVSEEGAELKVLITQLKNTNANSKQRSDLMTEINNKYGLTLKNLDDEKKFVNQLDLAYQGFIKSLRERIFLQVKQEEITKLLTEEIALNEKLEESIGRVAALGLFQKLPDQTKEAAEATFAEITKLADLSTAELRDVLAADPTIQQRGVTEGFLNIFKQFNEEQKKQFEESFLTADQAANRVRNVLVNNAQLTREQQQRIFSGPVGEGFLLQQFEQEGINSLLGIQDALLALEGDFEDFDFAGAFSGKDIQPGKIKSILLDLQKELRKARLETQKQAVTFIDPKNLDEEIDKLKQAAEADKVIVRNTIKDRVDKAREAGQLGAKEAALFKLIQDEKIKQIDAKTQEDISDLREAAAKDRAKTISEIEQVELEKQIEVLNNEEERLLEDRKELKKSLIRATSKAERDILVQELGFNEGLIKANLDEEFDLTVKAINKKRDFELQQEGLTQEERELINKQSDLEILKARQSFNDKIKDFNKEIVEDTKETEEERRDAIIDGIKDVVAETEKLINEIIDLQIKQTDTAIEAQEKRVERATELAEKGNVALLEAEEKRLSELQKKREKFVRAQQALAAVELVINSVIAVSKAAAQGGAAAPFTVAATLIALAAGLVAAKAQAQAAAGGFAEGGYTGDGGKYESAGTVHKGEFVFNQEKTRKFRPLFEEIHKGRNPFLTQGLNEQMIVVQNSGFDAKLDRIEKAIKKQDRLQLSIDERGISGIVSTMKYKDQRIRNKATR